MSYVLHYAPDNASLIVRLALEEMGLPYETRLVDRRTRAQDSPAYKALNPAGRIPVLETPEGRIFETAAILLWLADRHGPDWPKPADAGRGEALKWLFYLSNDIQTPLRHVFYAERFAGPDQQAQTRFREATQAQIAQSLVLLDRALPGTTWCLAGDQPGILDCYVAPLLRWTRLYPTQAAGWFCHSTVPRLARLTVAMETRASVKAVQEAEGLGPNPFSKPQLANPSQGSAH